ncbi:hypothetical protein, partial [Myroides sp. C20-1]
VVNWREDRSKFYKEQTSQIEAKRRFIEYQNKYKPNEINRTFFALCNVVNWREDRSKFYKEQTSQIEAKRRFIEYQNKYKPNEINRTFFALCDFVML